MSTFLRGVEMPLPPGERVLWQGSPNALRLLVRAFHARKIVIYFAALMVLAAVFARDHAAPFSYFLNSAFWLSVSASVAIGFAGLVAFMTSRSTLYAITERRIVMKIGVALPVVINIPLRIVQALNVQRDVDGMGSLAVVLEGDSRVAFIVLWPHVRGWRLKHPEPLLRCIDDVETVGALLRDALMGRDNIAPLGELVPATAAPSLVTVTPRLPGGVSAMATSSADALSAPPSGARHAAVPIA